MRVPARLWLAILAAICAAELATHTGRASGFLESSRPLYGGNFQMPGDGYVSWVGTVPVLHDADGLLTLTSLFLGERGPEETGILDRRAAYAYISSLAIPLAGAYRGFMLVNLAFWWAGAAASYWFVLRRWNDPSLAVATSLLVATGNGLVFMAGVPMSYLAAYASVFILLALAEWLHTFSPGATLRSWLLLGWAAGVASTLYFAHLPALIFWWVYGLRRVAWRNLLAATVVMLAISLGWEVYGRDLVGLDFSTDNSSAVGGAVGGWLANLQKPSSEVLTYVRGGSLAGAAAIRGTLLSAFPYPFWILAAIGFGASCGEDRNWAIAIAMGGLLPAIMLLSLLPLPRAAFYMYPAVYLMAARGALVLGHLAARAFRPAPAALFAAAALGVLVLTSNLDLFGYHVLTARFHESMGARW